MAVRLPDTRIGNNTTIKIPEGKERISKDFPDMGSKYIINPYYEKEKLSFKEALDLINIMTAQLLNDVEFRNK